MFKKMREGKAYTNVAAISYTKYFLDCIYSDYGKDSLNLGLKALKLHIEKRTQIETKLGEEFAKKYKTNFTLYQ